MPSRTAHTGSTISTIVARSAAIALGVGVLMGVGSWPSAVIAQSTTLMQESFEDVNYTTRGWYDSTGGPVSTVEKFAGNASFECRFTAGATKCSGGDPQRHALTATDAIYISYYIKHSTNWVGSGRTYHPHMFYFLTNEDGAFAGPAYNYLDAYIENIGGVPAFLVQDGHNIDETRIGQNLVNVTESRSVGGCNGDSDGYGNGECYLSGSVHWNSKTWLAGQVYFDSISGSPFYKGNWHLVEAYFRLNSINQSGKGVADGIIRYWYDGSLIMEHTNIMMRTGTHPTMKFNQLLLSPYIGDGSPADQRMWIDNLMIATARPATPPPPPGGSAPRAPTNLRIVR